MPDFFATLTDEEFDHVSAMSADEIRKAASIVNGGEAAALPCSKCGGTGYWRVGYPCFACKSTGKITARQASAAKGRETKERNEAERRESFLRDNADAIDFLAKNSDWSDFYRSLYSQFEERGSLSDRQLESVRSGMAKAKARAEEKAAAKVANSGTIELSAIDKLFATAKSNGLKKPIWRAAGMSIHTDRQFGCDDLWVKEEAAGGYVGKIVNGEFKAFRRASPETLPALREIAADPLKAAIAYGQATNNCSCCGRFLQAGVSVVSGIGPICAGKWGLEGYREAAADAIAEEKAAHAKEASNG